jgi:hypothetical protein
MSEEIQNGEDSPYLAGDADRLAAALPPVAKIQFRCPTGGESVLLGPDDYEIYIPRSSDSNGQHFYIAANCRCGRVHTLITERFS